MEIQELTLQAVVSQLRPTQPSLHFVDNRGSILEQLKEDLGLPEWGYSHDFVELFSKDRSAAIHVASDEVRVMFEHIEDPGDVREMSEQVLESMFDRLKLESFRFIGVRTWWTAAADSFEELNDWMVDRFSKSGKDLFDAVGQKPTDSAWVFEFHDKDPKHTLNIGPMTAEQAVSQTFRDNDPENFPPQFLYIDLDRVYNDDPDLNRPDALDLWRKSFDRSLEMGERIGKQLFE